MSSTTFPLVGGRRMRLTRLDACGVPAWGNFTQAVSKGFVSVAVTANYDDGTEVVLRNASGERCVDRPAEAELINLALAINFCAVDPDIYAGLTGFPKIIDPVTGDTIGFKVNRGIRPASIKNALEVWADAQGTAGCDDADEVPYGYLLWPYINGARVSDYTIEEGAVTFSVNSAITKDGSQWGEGPYLVARDEEGDPATLAGVNEVVEDQDHQVVFRTTVPPPEPTDGLVPLDDPEGAAATTATAGIPGTYNGVRPATVAALQASAITGSGGASPWTTGQMVYVGNGDRAYWAGSGATPKWEPGVAP